MTALVVSDAIASVPAPADPPQTFDSALRGFRREVMALKKGSGLAGRIERQLATKSKELLREAAREVLQAQADSCSPHCPVCGARLQNVEQAQRTILTQWGEVTLRRAYGKCPRCGCYRAPADEVLGLEQNEQSSPDLAEKMSWLATRLPPAQAAEVIEHLTGQRLSPSRIDRQARKKGEQALLEREEDRRRALSTEERFAFSRENRPEDEPAEFTLAILMDGWMIRERDQWGLSQALRAQGLAPQRWHEVKAARLFRLDARAQTQSGRTLLLESRYVATRGGPEELGELLHTEALRFGLLRAKRTLVIADGGVWIWNIAADRFSHAQGTLDFYHASDHLWAVAHALFGEGGEQARLWVEPLLHQLRHGQEGRVLKTLADLAAMAKELPIAATVEREAHYFESHREHVAYEAKAMRGEPIGSGSMESACKQYQLRFKRPGQFWHAATEEWLLELDNRRRNGRWDSLWPHLRLSEN